MQIKSKIICEQIGYHKYRILYNRWRFMIRRCTNPKDERYQNYGARGIKVCEEWLEFESFAKWALSNGYSPDLEIDRRNVDGNYEPNNCRWVTHLENSRNKRPRKTPTYCVSSNFITINGITKSLSDWAKDINIPYHTMYNRFANGFKGEELLNPTYTRRKRKST